MPNENSDGADIARAIEAMRMLSPSAQVFVLISAARGRVTTKALASGVRVWWRPPLDKAPIAAGTLAKSARPRVRHRASDGPDLDAIGDELGLPRGRGG
jgi:hypothetical protein